MNSSRLLLTPEHIATQLREESIEDLNQSTSPQPRNATPTPRDLPTPTRLFHRRSTEAHDTRRHGIYLTSSPLEAHNNNNNNNLPTFLAATTPTNRPLNEQLPSYTPLPSLPSRRLTAPPSLPLPPIAAQSRQRELRALQHQWRTHRRHRSSHPSATEPTRFRAPISHTHDLPPPYAEEDPYPLFLAPSSPPSQDGSVSGERKPPLWARVVMYPFVPEGEMLDRAASGADRVVGMVKDKVVKGVKGTVRGVREGKRTGRGRKGAVDGSVERSGWRLYEGAWRVVE